MCITAHVRVEKLLRVFRGISDTVPAFSGGISGEVMERRPVRKQ